MPAQTTVHTYHLDWLLDAAPSALDAADPVTVARLPYVLPPEVGEAWIEMLELRDGIVLFRAVHKLEPSPHGQLVHLMDVSTAPGAPVFNAQVWLSGLGCHREYWRGPNEPPTEIVAGPGRDTFRHHGEWRAEILVEGGVTSEMRSVILPDAMLSELIGDEAATTLLAKLGLCESRPTVVWPVPLHVSAPLREAMNTQFTGQARRLFAQARVLDYLVQLLQFVHADQGERGERRHQKRIRELHDYLTGLEGRLPTLSDLARDFGLSAQRLNQAFVVEYGQSIFSYMTEHRLAEAHALLTTDAMPMKLLAARLGYSHVNHFITAFKKKYGYPPGSLRKASH